MDIKEIAEQVSKRIYVEDGLLLSKFISEKFAEALIESYKAELLKEVGEPVAYLKTWSSVGNAVVDRKRVDLTADCETWLSNMFPKIDPLYTSDQVAAAVARATKPLEKEVERLKTVPMKYRRMAFNAQLQDENNELRQQLAAAKEENGRLENQVLARDAELWGRTQEILGLKDQLAKAEQLWQVAQGRCDGLEEKLAKAEQRVAEACADLLVDRFKHEVTGTLAIRAGEWRKFVKEM